MNASVILTAFSYGLFPVLIWLFFWLSEDRVKPEPKILIARAFLAGIIAVPFAVVIELAIETYIGDGFTKTLLWALTEESIKYIFAVIFVLRSRAYDEALDAVIYMICVALGFAALENSFYALAAFAPAILVAPLSQIDVASITNLRFIGATLVHTLSSAAIGISMAFAFYKSVEKRTVAVIYGLILATSLHGLFNFFIMSELPGIKFTVFVAIWIMALGLILIAERIKKLDADCAPNIPEN